MSQLAEQQHYESAEEAAEAARAFLAPQYQPFGMEPKVYEIEACGLKVVCLPWAYSKRALAFKGITKDLSDLQAGMKIIEARFVDTLWYIDGQQTPGRKGARDHARALADLGEKYGDLIPEIVRLCGALDEEARPPGK